MSLFTQCNIFIQLNQKFHENEKEVDVDVDYLIEQKEKEIKELKKEMLKKPKDFEPDIFIAARDGKISSLEYLIEKEGVDMNIQAKKYYDDDIICKGCNALHIACMCGNLEVVQYLLEKGADIESLSSNGSTPLYLASYNGNTEVVKYLISKGANKNFKNKYGSTPYLGACGYPKSDQSQRDIIQKLLEWGKVFQLHEPTKKFYQKYDLIYINLLLHLNEGYKSCKSFSIL